MSKKIENLITGFDLLSQPKPKVTWLVDKKLPCGTLTALVGESGVGKSTFLRQLALSIITRKSAFLGSQLNVKHGKVLYISTEDGRIATYNSLCKQLGYTDEMFDEHDMLIKNDPILHNIFFLFDHENIEYSIRTLLETHSLDLVIIDAYSDVFGEEMNQSNQVRKFLTEYTKLADEFAFTTIFMHHFGKSMRVKAKDRILGSVGFEQKMRSILSLEFKNNQTHLKVIKGNYINKNDSDCIDILELSDDLLFTKIASFDSGAERAPKRTKLDILLEDHHEVLIEVQNGNASYKDAIELLNDLGISVSEGTIGRALKRLEQQQ
jgi:predicted ATP-dependent serine protease